MVMKEEKEAEEEMRNCRNTLNQRKESRFMW